MCLLLLQCGVVSFAGSELIKSIAILSGELDAVTAFIVSMMMVIIHSFIDLMSTVNSLWGTIYHLKCWFHVWPCMLVHWLRCPTHIHTQWVDRPIVASLGSSLWGSSEQSGGPALSCAIDGSGKLRWDTCPENFKKFVRLLGQVFDRKIPAQKCPLQTYFVPPMRTQISSYNMFVSWKPVQPKLVLGLRPRMSKMFSQVQAIT